MKVTFIYQDMATLTARPWTGRFYCGIGYLSACLKKAGHYTSLIHLIKYPISREDILAQLRADPPDLVAFSATSHSFPDAAAIAGWIREAGLKLPTISGGVHPTLNPEEVIATPGIDYLCVGEGEEAFLELCEKLESGRDPTGIANIWANHGGKVYQNAPRPPIVNLDSIPFPDREIFDYPRLYHQQEGEAEVMTSRGCPYQCTYCCNMALRNATTRGLPNVRFRSVDNVIAEIQDIVQKYPFVRFLQFDDDLPFVKLDWTREFSEKYKRLVNLPFRFNARPNLVSREQLELLREANCCEAKIGLESGNEDIMNRVLNRNLTLKHIKDAFATCRDLGIRTFSLNMVGLPYETPRTILDTIKLNAQVRSDICQVSIFHPYKQTPLYDLCRSEGFLTEKQVPDFFSDTVLEMTSVSPAQVLFYRRYFRFLVFFYRMLYKLPGAARTPVLRIVDAMLASKKNVRFLSHILDPLARIKRKIVFALQGAHS